MAILVGGAIVLALLIYSRGWESGWRTWGVATKGPPWIDLRVITGAVRTVGEGGNPYLSNPFDPNQRPFNYPAVWLRLFPAEFSETGYGATGLLFAGAAITTLLLWVGPLAAKHGVLLGVLLLSPALMLGVERANTDLVVCALVVLSLLGLRTSTRSLHLLALTGLLIASALKLFPVVALAIVALLGPRESRRIALGALVVVVLWFAAHTREIVAAITNTQIGAIHSYGRSTLPIWLQLHSRVHGWPVDQSRLEHLSLFATIAALAWALWRGNALAKIDANPPRAIDWLFLGWLIGAVIYVLTFAAGSSFHYRLWFTLPGLPWLFDRAQRGEALANWSRVALISLAVLCFASGVWWIPLTWISLTAGWAYFVACGVLGGAMLKPMIAAARGPQRTASATTE